MNILKKSKIYKYKQKQGKKPLLKILLLILRIIFWFSKKEYH
jgi:hypothetical protein